MSSRGPSQSPSCKCPQVLLNLRNGHSGQVSGATTALYCAGNGVRVYTTSQLLAGDIGTLAASSASFLLNLAILGQVAFLPRPPQ